MFIGSDNIAAGMSRILTDAEVTTLGEDVIAWSGLVPKGYEGLTYGLVDLTLGSKTMLLSKISSTAHNIVSIKYATPTGQKPSLIRDIKVYIEKLSKNRMRYRHVIELKEPTFNPLDSVGAANGSGVRKPSSKQGIEKGGIVSNNNLSHLTEEQRQIIKNAENISTAKTGKQATAPRDLNEQLFWNEVKNNPKNGDILPGMNNDPRFPQSAGFQKMQATHKLPDGSNITIHYQYNSNTGKAYDMKIDSVKPKWP